MDQNKTSKKQHILLIFIVAIIVYAALSYGVFYHLGQNGRYPVGSDVSYHIHRGELVYNALKEGHLWPNYDFRWYNGVEILRYWSPLCAYAMAGCNAIMGGDSMQGYLLFSALLCFFSCIPWLYIGKRLKRPVLGAVLGALWFFAPHNIFVCFAEGNIPRALTMVFLPVLIFLCNRYLEEKRWQDSVGITLSFICILMCHIGYAGMVALAVILYLIVSGISRRSFAGTVDVLVSIVLGFVIIGIYLVPSIIGGIANVDSSEAMAGFFQPLALSLNPFARIKDMFVDYFGLILFAIAVIGLFFSKKRSKGLVVAGLILCILTAESFYPVLSKLPGGQYLWMMRFISIATCLILIGLIEWRTMKKSVTVIICILLAIDSVPSVKHIYGDQDGMKPFERFELIQEASLLKEVQAATTQRLAVMQEGVGVIDVYSITDYGIPTNTTFGAGWEAANTSANIVQINKASVEGQYLYMFDRCKELGNDSILIRPDVVKNLEENPIEKMDAIAGVCGYKLVDANSMYRFYHLDAGYKNWGVKTKYRNIAIGSVGPGLALYFPSFEEADSDNLNDYTFEELIEYDTIYLSGFTYDEREYAEKLIADLSDAGVRIVICADGIPENRKSHDRSFLGVVCSGIEFSNGYPELETIHGNYFTTLFPREHRTMNTFYVNGLDEVWGRVYDNDIYLPFYGTVRNDNIVVIGINLTYYFGLTHDQDVGMLLSYAMNVSPNELPERSIVPIGLEYGYNSFAVTTLEDDVNTTLAFHDSFESSQPISSRQNLTHVDAGKTVVTLKYPYPVAGAITSAVGLILFILYEIDIKRRWGNRKPE